MAAELFEAQVRNAPAVAVIEMRGEINGAADDRLSAVWTEATSNGGTTVLLNFHDVAYINSTGIALVVRMLAGARALGVRVLACGLSDHYREIFDLTRLSDFIEVFPDEASALVGAAEG